MKAPEGCTPNFGLQAVIQRTIPYDDVIHVKYNYSVNDYMGGNQFGQPDNEPLLKTLQLNHQVVARA